MKSDIIRSSWQLEPIRLAGTLLCGPFYPWVCQINDSFKTPLHYISPFSQRTLYIPWKINDIMKIWINLNKWLHIICLTLKTMTTVYTQSGKLLSASVRDCAAEATHHCSHSPQRAPPKIQMRQRVTGVCLPAPPAQAGLEKWQIVGIFPNRVCDTAPGRGLIHSAGSIWRLLSGFAGWCDIVREG